MSIEVATRTSTGARTEIGARYLGEPAVHAHLKTVVTRARFIIGDANNAKTLERLQEVTINPWVSLQSSRLELIDVALALSVGLSLASSLSF